MWLAGCKEVDGLTPTNLTISSRYSTRPIQVPTGQLYLPRPQACSQEALVTYVSTNRMITGVQRCPQKIPTIFVFVQAFSFPEEKSMLFIVFSRLKEVKTPCQRTRSRAAGQMWPLSLLVWTTQCFEGFWQHLKVRGFYTKISISSFKKKKRKKGN